MIYTDQVLAILHEMLPGAGDEILIKGFSSDNHLFFVEGYEYDANRVVQSATDTKILVHGMSIFVNVHTSLSEIDGGPHIDHGSPGPVEIELPLHKIVGIPPRLPTIVWNKAKHNKNSTEKVTAVVTKLDFRHYTEQEREFALAVSKHRPVYEKKYIHRIVQSLIYSLDDESTAAEIDNAREFSLIIVRQAKTQRTRLLCIALYNQCLALTQRRRESNG